MPPEMWHLEPLKLIGHSELLPVVWGDNLTVNVTLFIDREPIYSLEFAFQSIIPHQL